MHKYRSKKNKNTSICIPSSNNTQEAKTANIYFLRLPLLACLAYRPRLLPGKSARGGILSKSVT